MSALAPKNIATNKTDDDLVLIKKNDDDQLMINMTQSKDNISTHQNDLPFFLLVMIPVDILSEPCTKSVSSFGKK